MMRLNSLTVDVQPILPQLRAARLGATHMLILTLHGSGAGFTLDCSIPLPVRQGDAIVMPADNGWNAVTIYQWNGSLEAPTVTPDILIDARGGLRASLMSGVLTPLDGNAEKLLKRPRLIGRPRTLLAVPCPTHGEGPCPSPAGCKARRLAAGLDPRPSGRSGTTGAERARRKKLQQRKENVMEILHRVGQIVMWWGRGWDAAIKLPAHTEAESILPYIALDRSLGLDADPIAEAAFRASFRKARAEIEQFGYVDPRRPAVNVDQIAAAMVP